MRTFTLVPLLASLLMFGAHTVHAASWNVAELMQMLGQQKSGKATFVEKKYIAMLEQPLESSGEFASAAFAPEAVARGFAADIAEAAADAAPASAAAAEAVRADCAA